MAILYLPELLLVSKLIGEISEYGKIIPKDSQYSELFYEINDQYLHKISQKVKSSQKIRNINNDLIDLGHSFELEYLIGLNW